MTTGEESWRERGAGQEAAAGSLGGGLGREEIRNRAAQQVRRADGWSLYGSEESSREWPGVRVR